MDFVRKVVNGVDLEGVVEMPNSLINRKVEILIFPIDEVNKKNKKKKTYQGF